VALVVFNSYLMGQDKVTILCGLYADQFALVRPGIFGLSHVGQYNISIL
jgi:hypothetical protein